MVVFNVVLYGLIDLVDIVREGVYNYLFLRFFKKGIKSWRYGVFIWCSFGFMGVGGIV